MHRKSSGRIHAKLLTAGVGVCERNEIISFFTLILYYFMHYFYYLKQKIKNLNLKIYIYIYMYINNLLYKLFLN